MTPPKGRRVLRLLFLVVPLIVVTLGVLLPVEPRIAIATVLVGFLLYQAAILGAFDAFLPDVRHFSELRAETDRLLTLVRELNWIAAEERAVRADGSVPRERIQPILGQLHESVDRLPAVAGKRDPHQPVALHLM